MLHLPYVARDDDFFELGGDSLAAVLLFIRLEQEFGNVPPLAALLEHPSVAEFARLLASGCDSREALVVGLQPVGNRRPLFLLTGADGQLLVFRHLATRIGRDQPLFGIAPQGLHGCEPDRTIEEMAARSVRELKRVQPSGPYRLAGFSAGGVIAFEMARQLHEMGDRVGTLLLIDSFPGLPFSPSFLSRMIFQVRNLASRPWPELRPILVRGRRQPRSRFVGCCVGPCGVELDRWTNRTPNVARVAQATYQALKAYVPRPYPGNAVLLRASIRPRVRRVAEDMGWQMLCKCGLRVIRVYGTHSDCLGPRYVASLARTVRMSLAQRRSQPLLFTCRDVPEGTVRTAHDRFTQNTAAVCRLNGT